MTTTDSTAGKTAPSKTTPPGKSGAGFLKSNLREYGMLLSLFAIMVFFEIVTNGTLLRPLNLTNLVLQNSYIVIMALGMLLVIVAGHIDLSVGSVAGFIGALAAVMMVQWGVPALPTTIVCLVAGGVIGAAQGYWVAFFRIPSFIVTLAGMLVFKGLTLALLAGQSVGPFPQAFQRLSSGFIPDFSSEPGLRITSMILGVAVAAILIWVNYGNRQKQVHHGVETEPFGFFLLKNGIGAAVILYFTYLLSTYKGLPNVLIIMFALIAIYAFVTNRTIIGRRIYALGGNEKAAKLSGVKTDRLTFFTFVNMGMLAALAGLIFAARLNTATPKAGVGFELDVIAACFIGGASAYGGVGTVVGAVIGAFIMGVMNNGMSILGIGIDYQQVIKGLVLLAAVFIDVYNKNK
ncbi:multiple monosaccharide ABC transporter membrane protein [Pseudoxanthobacter soli DSM 19599]|uniref:Xylose transport system permease protein XylH n=2 Tax=Pseudoxanthobacter TaxID=433838 RepID=A0A1M7ZKX8_9HYPH|nr:multiple monosaccharide ABC transporter permease [Pseudoxanthobacter soli]SHO65565.1 multiple monosaccharide ABC transporter membrane protein [Pseudoxanthobacter soli DSM 19599]